MSTPRASVVVPAFNADRTIRRAIGTVTGQTFTDLEIIVVDDGSTDATADKVRAVTDERVHLVTHERNRGAAIARNSGISAAHGTYIAFLDADDEWFPEKLESQLGFMSRFPDGVGATTTGFILKRMDEGTAVERIPTATNGWTEEFLDVCEVAPGTTLLAHRDVFQDVGMYEPLPRYEDWDWLLRVVGRFPFGCLGEVLAVVNRQGWPSPGTVDESVEQLRQRQTARIADLAGSRGLRRFEASLELERAIARFHANDWLGVATHVVSAAMMSPNRTAAFARRAYERYRGRV